jgi:hypothetical protein
MFTFEYIEMMIIYGESGKNSKAAARLYRERFPHHRHPSSDVFLRLVNRARSTGSLVPNRKRVDGVDRTVRTPHTEGVVLQSFTEDGTRSVRNVADILNVSKSTVQRILKDNHMHPYHYTKVQNLLPDDYAPRLEFSNWLLQGHEENTGFLANVLFTDEYYFCRQGTFNSHNFHVWSTENPNANFPHSFQHRFSINLWAGILGDSLVSMRVSIQHFFGKYCHRSPVCPGLVRTT